MKNSGFVIGSVLFATLVLYLLAYYFLPPPPPSPALVALFAAIAIVLVWALQWVFRKMSSKKSGHQILLWVAGPLVLLCFHPAPTQAQQMLVTCKFDSGPRAGSSQSFQTSSEVSVGSPCQDGNGSAGTITAARAMDSSRTSTTGAAAATDSAAPAASAPAAAAAAEPAPSDEAAPPPPPPPPPVEAAPAPAMSLPSPTSTTSPKGAGILGGSLPRITGTAILLRARPEEQGYGLYSYALLTHRPQDSELPRYRAFLMALVGLPTAQEVGGYVQKSRINITYFPLTASPTKWDMLTTHARVDYVLAHYDYARGAVMLASLPERIGTGPVLVSVLRPLSANQHPHPVLVQDLSKAQPVLMSDYVAEFVDQAAKDHFWEAITLEVFSLHMRNFLETAAIGLGMSKTAVDGWVHEDK